MRIRCVNSWIEADGVSDRRSQLPLDLLHPDTVVDFVPIRERPAGTISSYYEAAIMDMYVAEAALDAELAGYDAVVIDSISDPGLATLRSRLNIPVVGAGLSSYLTALLIGRRFSILSYLAQHRIFYERVLTDHGLLSHCASIRPVGREPDHRNLDRMSHRDEVELLVAQGRAAIADDGADVIVLGSVSMHSTAEVMREQLAAPVVDPSVVAFLDAERLVTLRLSSSKVAYRSPEVLQDELWPAGRPA